MTKELLNIIMHDGSRQFGELPQFATWHKLSRHVRKLNGASVTELLTDHVIEAWIDFTFRGYQFTVNNQFGDYWFFVQDPHCPDDILEEVLSHCRLLLGEEREA
jgi:hypothetical protein